MFVKLFIIMSFVVSLKCSSSSRRIAGGQRVIDEKRYMAYLIKSEKSNRQLYDSWLCGGAIVSPRHILTSAACLADVTYLYAIAGYKKYVRTENIDMDECTRERKQRVVRTCVPIKYKIDFENVFKWAYMDIGFAIVEKPYDFTDVTYRRHCSYTPAQISINFDSKYEEKDTDMFVYGWGHNYALRLPGDYQDYNQEYLQETTTRVAPKSYCDKYFKNLSRTIEHYLICCNGKGDIDREGNMDNPENKNNEGCRRRRDMQKMEKCDEYLNYEYDFDLRRNENTAHHKTDLEDKQVRRQGVICQNDHGGPLVTWVGSEEYVVGVAITSLYNSKYECIGPHLYSSTTCASMFIKCVLDFPGHPTMRRMCENLGKDHEYAVHEAEIDWNKIDGSQDNDNEKVKNVYSPSENDSILMFSRNDTENNQNDAKKNVEMVNTRTNEENQNKEVNVQIFPPADQLYFDADVDDVVII